MMDTICLLMRNIANSNEHLLYLKVSNKYLIITMNSSRGLKELETSKDNIAMKNVRLFYYLQSYSALFFFIKSAHASNMSSNETKSFEVSRWFSSVLERVKNVEKQQVYLNKWRQFAKKLKQTKQLETMQYIKRKYLQRKYIYNSKSRWLYLYSQLFHRRKKQLFTIAQKQLSEVRKQAEDIQRAKRSVNYPNSSSEDCYNSKSESTIYSDNGDNEISAYQKKWISMAQRFINQTKYQQLQIEFENFQDQKRQQLRERKEVWHDMACIMMLNQQKVLLKKRARQLSKVRDDWYIFYSHMILNQKLNRIKAVHQKWKSQPFQNEEQIHKIWYHYYLSLKFKHNIIRMIRESNAYSTLTNFFKYLLQVHRAQAVANYFPFRYIAGIRSIVKQSTINSAKTIGKLLSQKDKQDSSAFANNWTECIAEAYASIASHQIGRARSIELKQKSNKNQIKDKNSIFTQLTLPKVKANIDDSELNNQNNVDYPLKIIKITRDFDPNEEHNNEIQAISTKEEKALNADEQEYTIESNEKCLVVEVPDTNKYHTNLDKTKNLSIEIYPSNSQSSMSILSDDDNIPTQDIDVPAKKSNTKAKLSITPPIYKELKEKKKKQPSKKKDFFAPVVIAENTRYFSPIEKRQHNKSHKKKDPNINDILNMVGISSSLELLDEDSEMKSDNEGDSEINFRFDDDLSESLDSQNDLVVDLMKLQTSSSEDKRIRQSLLEASEAHFSLPNEEEEQKQEIKSDHSKKIDLLSLSNSTGENQVLTPPNLSDSISSYNKSGSDKEDHTNAQEKGDLQAHRKDVDDDDEISVGQKLSTSQINSRRDDSNCKFNFEPENNEQLYKPLSPIQDQANDDQMVEVNSYISDKDVDAAMHEYSSEEKK